MNDSLQDQAPGIDLNSKIAKLVIEIHDLARQMDPKHFSQSCIDRIRKMADELSDFQRDF